MRRIATLSFWGACALVVGIVSSLAGCAGTGGGEATTPMAVSDVKSVAGKWAGVMEGRGSGQYDLIELNIKDDSTYDVSTSRTMGAMRGGGTVALRDGQLVFQGPNARGTGTLMGGSGGERVMRINVTFESAGSVSQNVSANLRPSR